MRRKERRHHVTRSAVEWGNPDAVIDDKQQERKDDEAYHINTVLYRYIG